MYWSFPGRFNREKYKLQKQSGNCFLLKGNVSSRFYKRGMPFSRHRLTLFSRTCGDTLSSTDSPLSMSSRCCMAFNIDRNWLPQRFAKTMEPRTSTAGRKFVPPSVALTQPNARCEAIWQARSLERIYGRQY